MQVKEVVDGLAGFQRVVQAAADGEVALLGQGFLGQGFQQPDNFHQGRAVYATLVDNTDLLQEVFDNGGT